jgi:hypothetical protein
MRQDKWAGIEIKNYNQNAVGVGAYAIGQWLWMARNVRIAGGRMETENIKNRLQNIDHLVLNRNDLYR